MSAPALLDTFEVDTNNPPALLFCQSCGEAVSLVHGFTLAELLTEAEAHVCDPGEAT